MFEDENKVEVPLNLWLAVKTVIKGEGGPSTPGQWYSFIKILEDVELPKEAEKLPQEG